MDDWRSGKMWYNTALESCDGFPIIFEQSLQPRFSISFEPDAEGVTFVRLLGEDCEEFIAGKLEDKLEHVERIRAILAKSEAGLANEKQE